MPNKENPELKDMTATIYRLNLLCNRFEQDKDIILQEIVDTKKTVKTLQIEIAAFAKMRGEIAETLSTKIEQASKIIVRDAHESIRKTLKENMNESIERLDQVSKSSAEKIKFFYAHDKKRIWQVAIGLIALPLATSIIIAKLLMPKPIALNVDGRTCESYMQKTHSYMR